MSSESADLWNLHIGSLWAELLRHHRLDPAGTVVEIGPGFTDKIARGLAEVGFCGTLYVVEPNGEARRWLERRYHRILPQARILPLDVPLTEVGSELPTRIESLLLNHMLDDLVLAAALPAKVRQRVFSAIRPGAPSRPEVAQTWRRLFADPARLGEISGTVLDDLGELVAAVEPRLFGASQYPSWHLRCHGLGEVDRLAGRLLSQLAGRVGRTAASDRAILRHRGQDPDHWLILDHPARYAVPSPPAMETRWPEV